MFLKEIKVLQQQISIYLDIFDKTPPQINSTFIKNKDTLEAILIILDSTLVKNKPKWKDEKILLKKLNAYRQSLINIHKKIITFSATNQDYKIIEEYIPEIEA